MSIDLPISPVNEFRKYFDFEFLSLETCWKCF